MEPQGTITRVDGNPVKITLNGQDHMILNIDESQKKDLIAIVRQSRPTADRVQLYRQLNLFPVDFGSTHTSWTAWLDANSGPIVDGAILTSSDVASLRQAMQAVSRQHAGRSMYRTLPATHHAILRKVGLRPVDCGFGANLSAGGW